MNASSPSSRSSPMRRFATPLAADALAAIAECLRAGGVVLMPTDTVYGIAAHPDRPDALARLFALKGRDASKPVPLLADSMASVLKAGLDASAAAQRAAASFWPGALTLVLDRPDGLDPCSRPRRDGQGRPRVRAGSRPTPPAPPGRCHAPVDVRKGRPGSPRGATS